MREELLVSAFEDVELGVVEIGVLVHGAVSLPDEAAHPRAALRRELAVEDDDDSFLRGGRDDRGLQEEILHVLLLVQVERSLTQQTKTDTQFTTVDVESFLNCYTRSNEVPTNETFNSRDSFIYSKCHVQACRLTWMCPPSNS